MDTKQSPPNVEEQRKNGVLGSQLPRFFSLAIWPMSVQLWNSRGKRKEETRHSNRWVWLYVGETTLFCV
jgi:hypothetical protein